MPIWLPSVLTLDSSLGRVNKESFSQMTLMELFCQHITNKENIYGDVDYADRISHWTGVELHDNQDVSQIQWYALRFHTPLDGSVALEWLPCAVRVVILWGNHLQGTVCLKHLPNSLETLNLSSNNFSGTPDFEHLPDSLIDLYLQDNPFSGCVSLMKLPKHLANFNLGNTDVSGEVDFDSIPETLVMLDVSNTKLSGVLRSSYGTKFFTEGSEVLLVDL